MEEQISIIVPVYKVEKYICRCIDSIINQSYKRLEIILVDDGSPDSSGVICDEYQKKDSRIKVIHKENAGLGFARNSGLEHATGKYVTFIDGDDYIGVDHIKNMYNTIKNTSTDTCIAGHTKVYKNKKVEHTNVCSGKIFKNNVNENILPRMCGADCHGNDYIEMSVCMVLFSNDIIQSNQLKFVSEKEYISEDLVFDFEYYPLSKGVCVSDKTDYYYCDNEGSLTTKYREDRFKSQIYLYKFLSQKAIELNIQDKCIKRLQNTVLAIARYSIKIEYKFKKINGKRIAHNNVHKICEDTTLQKILDEYDDHGIRIASRIINGLIKYKNYHLLKFIMNVKITFEI